MERGDTGLGRDAYGPPRRERDRLGYGPESYPSDDGYPAAAEEDDAAGPGRAVDAEEDDYGQLLRRPGEMPPRQQRLRQPGRPHPGQPGRFPRAPSRQALSRQMASRATAAGPVTACPTALGRADLRARAGRTAGTQMAACPTGQCRMAGTQMAACPTGQCRMAVLRTAYRTAPPSTALRRIAPRRIAVPRTPARHTAVSRTAAIPNGGPMPNGGQVPGRQSRLPNGRRVSPGADRLYRPPGPSAPGGTSGRHHGPGPAAPDPYADSWSRPKAAPGPGAPGPGAPGPGAPGPGAPGPAGPGRPAAGPAHGGPQPHGGPGSTWGTWGTLGLRRCASTRPPGRALMLLTAASGWGRRWAHRWNRRRR